MRTVKEHDERKTEILNASQALFFTKGYDKTTINDILKTIGIAKGTFYHYFNSKEEVLDAVVMRVIDQEVLAAQEIAKDKKMSAAEKIIHYLITQSTPDHAEKNEMLAQFPKVENALMKQRALQATLDYICPVLAEIIEEGNQSQEFNTDFPLEDIQFLIAGIQTTMDANQLQSDQEQQEQQVKSFIEIIFKILGINEQKITKKEVLEQIQPIFIN